MGGWIQRRFDPSKATTNSQYDNGGIGENFSNTQFSYLDGSVGMSYNSNLAYNPDNNFFIGAAYHHFNRPNQTFFYRNANIELQPKWVFSGGIKLGVADNAYMTILGDHSKQGGFSETVAGMMYGLKLGDDPINPDYTIHAGAFLRLNDAIIPVVKLDYTPFSFSLSYDANISKLKPSSYGRGGFEISFSYIGFRKSKGEYLLHPLMKISLHLIFRNNLFLTCFFLFADFTLFDSDKKEITLSELKGKPVLLLFFPLAFTSTCTTELCSVRDNIGWYNNINAKVFGISVDALQTLAKFKEDQQLNFTLLSDFNKDVSRLYESIYEQFGYNMKGVSKRSAFVIDKEGIIQYAEVLENAGEIPDFEKIKASLEKTQ